MRWNIPYLKRKSVKNFKISYYFMPKCMEKVESLFLFVFLFVFLFFLLEKKKKPDKYNFFNPDIGFLNKSKSYNEFNGYVLYYVRKKLQFVFIYKNVQILSACKHFGFDHGTTTYKFGHTFVKPFLKLECLSIKTNLKDCTIFKLKKLSFIFL